jgi:hypothetical protein
VAENLGSAVLTLSTDSKKFDKGLKSAKTKAGGLSKVFGKISRMKAPLLIGGAALASIGLIAKKAIDAADAMEKMSKKTGATVEALVALKLRAEIGGGSIDTVEKAFKRMSSTIVDASGGMKEATDALDLIGVSVDDLKGKTPEEQFFLLAKALNEIEDPTLKAAAAQDLFGRAGVDIIPMLGDLSKGLDFALEEVQRLGGGLTTEGAESAAAFNDALTELSTAFKSFGAALLDSGVLGMVTGLVVGITGIVTAIAQADPAFVAIGTGIGALVLIVAPLVAGFGFVASGVAALAPIFVTIGGAFSALVPFISTVVAILSGPIGLGIAIGAIVIALGIFMAKNEAVREFVGKAWEGIKTFFLGSLTAITGWVDDAWADIGKFFTSGAKAIDDTWDDLWTGVEKIVDVASGAITAIVKTWLKVATLGLFETGATDLSGVWGDLWTGIKDFIAAPIGWIKAGVSTLLTNLGEFFGGAKTAISGIWSSLWAAMLDALAAPFTAIKGKVSAFTGGVADFFTSLKDKLVGNSVWPDMLGTMGGQFDAFGTGMVGAGGAVPSMTGSVGSLFDGLSTKLTGVFTGEGSILDLGKAAFGGIKAAALDLASEAVLGLLNGKLSETLSTLKGIGKAAKGLFGAGASAAKTTTDATGAATGAAAGAASKIGGAIGGGVPGLVIAAADLVSSVIANFQFRRMNKLLGMIEETTRRGTLFLGDRADQGILGVLFKIEEGIAFGPATKAVEAIAGEVKGLGGQYFNASFDAMKDRLLTIGDNTSGDGAVVKAIKDLKAEIKSARAVTVEMGVQASSNNVVADITKAIKLNSGGLRTAIQAI